LLFVTGEFEQEKQEYAISGGSKYNSPFWGDHEWVGIELLP
jgi:hypothetical protein